jgi:cation:H+ antiporter
MLTVWTEFFVCVAIIGYAGSRLSRYGDAIAGHLGISRTWIGLILLATVTSLPELITGLSAVSFANAPNIALGDILGSCVFNLFVLAFLDILHRGDSVYSRASMGHILSASLGIVLISFVGINILLEQQNIGFSLGHIGLYTPVIVAMYFFAMRTVYRYEREKVSEFIEQKAETLPAIALRTAVLRYTLAALIVVAAGTALPFIGKALAHVMGWHTTFVGTLFIAFATSVPEVVVTISALRIGALDMAISNLLGSNLFDILILAIDDIFYTAGPLLANVSGLHVITALFAVLMNGFIIAGLIYRAKSKLFNFIGWTSVFLLLIYLFNAYVIYLNAE